MGRVGGEIVPEMLEIDALATVYERERRLAVEMDPASAKRRASFLRPARRRPLTQSDLPRSDTAPHRRTQPSTQCRALRSECVRSQVCAQAPGCHAPFRPWCSHRLGWTIDRPRANPGRLRCASLQVPRLVGATYGSFRRSHAGARPGRLCRRPDSAAARC